MQSHAPCVAQVLAKPPAIHRAPEVLIGTEHPEGAANGLPRTHWHGWRYLVADRYTSKLLIGIGPRPSREHLSVL